MYCKSFLNFVHCSTRQKHIDELQTATPWIRINFSDNIQRPLSAFIFVKFGEIYPLPFPLSPSHPPVELTLVIIHRNLNYVHSNPCRFDFVRIYLPRSAIRLEMSPRLFVCCMKKFFFQPSIYSFLCTISLSRDPITSFT